MGSAGRPADHGHDRRVPASNRGQNACMWYRADATEDWCPGVRSESPVLEDFLPSLGTALSWCTRRAMSTHVVGKPRKKRMGFLQRWRLNVDYRIECGLRAKKSTAGSEVRGELLGEAEKANAQSRKLQDLFEAGSDSSVIR